jgi:hypothetical protein
MTVVPMLADFAARLAFGLSIASLTTPWRDVPLPFFRTQCQVMLALLVLGALDLGRSTSGPVALWSVGLSAVLAYSSTVAWGLGLPRVGTRILTALALILAGWLMLESYSSPTGSWLLTSCARIASGGLLGVTLTAMLLGHHYLTAPAMSIQPLKRVIILLSGMLAARCLIAGIGICLARSGWLGTGSLPIADESWFFVAARWGMGFVGTAISIFMAWKTVQIRSTQSATGILYITMIFVLFGELTSLIVAADSGLLS